MSRVPIRLRLTLAFAGVMALVLAATGAFLYLRLASSLDRTIDDGLRARAADVAALAQQPDAELGPRPGDGDESFAELVDGSSSVLGPDELARARAGPISVERQLPGDDEGWRILATPVEGGRVAVVGASLEQRGDALEGLLAQLAIGLPLALVLASLAGYGLAASALRPVEAMRRRAEAISGARRGERLPVPEARDEIRRLGETLNGMLARLEQALMRERSFVADASHELRTPLALLKAELELALRRPRSADELEDALRSAAEETDRLVRLAEDLLVLARADEDGLPLRTTSLQARDVLASVGERFAGRLAESGRRIAVDAPAELPFEADRLRLEQALGNLVDNALRHGGGDIRLSAREEDGRVVLAVADDGPGFSPGFAPRAFDRFARADEARSGGGAGLGLSIVDVIARAHGGSARVVARDGGGADVLLSLPRAR